MFLKILQNTKENICARISFLIKLPARVLAIENVEIERAHRIGKEERDEPSEKRTIIVKFLNYKDK